MSIVNVGDVFDPEQTSYDEEGPQWRMSSQPLAEMMTLTDVGPDGEPLPFDVLRLQVQLLQFWRNPSAAEIALHDDPQLTMQFALTPGKHAMILSYRFEPHDWCDAPFQAACQPETPNLPDPEGQFHLPIWIGLIDAGTGILRAFRIYSWPPEFVQAVRSALAAQERAGKGMSREVRVAAGRAEVQAWLQKYPTASALVDAEAQVIVRGGKRHKILRNRQPSERPGEGRSTTQ